MIYGIHGNIVMMNVWFLHAVIILYIVLKIDACLYSQKTKR